MKIFGKILKLKQSYEFKKYLKYRKSRISKNFDIRIIRKKFVNKLDDTLLKFRIFKEKLKKIDTLDYRLNVEKFVVRSKNANLITTEEIETGRKIIRKLKNKRCKLQTRIFPFAACTKRPSDSRMGKGKSSRIYKYVNPLKCGKILYVLFMNSRRKKKMFWKHSRREFLNYILQKLKKKFSIFISIRRVLC